MNGRTLRAPGKSEDEMTSGPARNAHGVGYWLLVGWWWEPVAWLGRMTLWVLCFPLGLWRSMRKGRKNREARERRGYTSRQV